MLEHLKKIYLLFGDGKKRKIGLLFCLFMTISLFELISVGLIYPFLGILVDFEAFSFKYAEYLDFFGLKGHGEVILFAGLLLIFTYLFKFFLCFLRV